MKRASDAIFAVLVSISCCLAVILARVYARSMPTPMSTPARIRKPKIGITRYTGEVSSTSTSSCSFLRSVASSAFRVSMLARSSVISALSWPMAVSKSRCFAAKSACTCFSVARMPSPGARIACCSAWARVARVSAASISWSSAVWKRSRIASERPCGVPERQASASCSQRSSLVVTAVAPSKSKRSMRSIRRS